MKRMAGCVALTLGLLSSAAGSPEAGRVAGTGAAGVSVAGMLDAVRADGTVEVFLYVVAYVGMVVSDGASATALIIVWCPLGGTHCSKHEPGAAGIGTEPEPCAA